MSWKNKRNKLRIYNRLSFQLYVYFGAILTVFAILIGTIFLDLYKKNNTESYEKKMVSQAKRIAEKMQNLIDEDDREGSLTYMEYLDTLADSATTDIWFLANDSAPHPMAREFTNVDIEDVNLSKKLNSVIKRALKGKVTHNTGYDNVYEKVMLRVGVPIYDTKGNVIGITVLNAYVAPQKKLIQQSEKLILYSILGGLVVSFILMLFFTEKFSHPISKMRVTALELAEGNYDKRSNVKGKNEVGVLGESIDILAKRLRESQMERENLEQMRMDFFANVSHELRTPITVMRGYAESLVDDMVDTEEKRHQYYDRIVTECKSMERLVGDLLLLSKLQNPDFVVETDKIDLLELFQDLFYSVKGFALEKGIEVIYTSNAKGQVPFMGDYDRLRQLFLIIIDNAVKFSSKGKKVYISLEIQDKIVVKIKDEGVGISQEELPYIFEKFYKSQLRQNEKGSGLGLMIAKQIVAKHHGIIEVESTVGEGTEFTISFPRYEEK